MSALHRLKVSSSHDLQTQLEPGFCVRQPNRANGPHMALMGSDITRDAPALSHLILDVRNLSCRRGERAVFEGLSFSLKTGELIALTGRNGAGKSSLLALLAGRLRPHVGTIVSPALGETPLSEALHLIGHRDALKAALTARENLGFARQLLRNDLLSPAMAVKSDSALMSDAALSPETALARVGLAHVADLPAGYLSAGQKRRLALARVLVSSRPLWLLDEPNAALDSAGQALLTVLMQAHLEAGGAIIAATHGPLGMAASRVISMDDVAISEASAATDDVWGAGA